MAVASPPNPAAEAAAAAAAARLLAEEEQAAARSKAEQQKRERKKEKKGVKRAAAAQGAAVTDAMEDKLAALEEKVRKAREELEKRLCAVCMERERDTVRDGPTSASAPPLLSASLNLHRSIDPSH